MRIKKVNSDSIKLYDNTQVRLKTVGNIREVQFSAGNNNFCPIQNISKDKYLDKSLSVNSIGKRKMYSKEGHLRPPALNECEARI